MASKSFSNVKIKVTHLDLSKDASRSTLVSGENISHSLGKIARWYKDISWSGHKHTKADITDFAHTHTSLDTSIDVGSEYQPVYFLKGVPTALQYTIKTSVPANAVFTDTNTKVTSVGNHYTPSGGTTTSASGGTLTDITNSANGVQVVTGVTKDAAGHVTGVTSIALKSVNSNTVYAGGTGINIDANNAINHSNSITAITTAAFKKFKYDAQGHITGTANVTASDIPSHSHTVANITDFPVVITGGSQTSSSSSDGGSNIYTFTKSDGTSSTLTVKNGSKGSQGIQGVRGNSIYPITTAPESFTTTTGGFTPVYRATLSTVLSESKATEIKAGDQLRYSYYLYPVGYVDSTYVYLGTRVSIRGATGAGGAAATITVGTVTTGAAGSSASVTNSGTTAAAILDFVIPKGADGKNGTNGTNGTSASWFTGTVVTGTNTTATAFTVSGSKAGDMYLNTSTSNVYRASAANSWIYVCNIKGTAGTTPTLPTFSAEAGTNIGSVGTPSVSYNNGKFTFNYLKGAKGDKGDPGTNATTTAVVSTSANGLAPKVTDTNKFLKGDGTWATPYTHPSYTSKTSGLYKITVDASGHISAATAVAKADITGLGIPGSDTNTTYTFATGDNSGSFKVTPSGGAASNIQIKGLTHVVGGSTGDGMIVQTGGLIMIGAGESATNLQSANNISGDTEKLYLISDEDILFYVNCQTIDDRINIVKLNKEGSMDVNGNINIIKSGTLIQKQDSGSNYTSVIKWYKGGVSQNTYDPQIGQHTTGNTTGTICILPYATNVRPWDGNVGLFIGQGVLKLDGTNVSLEGHNHSVGDITGGTNKQFLMSNGTKGEWHTLAKADIPALDYVPNTHATTTYGTCSTAAATAAKVVTLATNGAWTLKVGAIIAVKFSETNTANNPTLNVNNTGAKPIYYNTAVLTDANLSYAAYKDRVHIYAYDGTNYVYLGHSVDNNSTYSDMKAATASAAGTHGLAPAPAAGKQTYFLRGDATWTEITPSLIGAAAEHTHPYLATSGGSMTGTINTNVNTSTYLNGNKGTNVIINSTNTAGAFTVLSKLNSTNGYFTQAVYKGNYQLHYTAKTTVDAGTNTTTKLAILLDESGNSTFPGTVTGSTFSGSGASLTSLNASNISSGTLSADRLATSGATAGSYGPSANASPAHSGTFSVPYITVDAKGRVTAISTKTITLPASGNTDSNVSQSATTTGNYRNVVLGYTNTSSASDDRTGTVTNVVYSSNKIFARPSEGRLYGEHLYAWVNSTDDVTVNLLRSGNSSWRFRNSIGNLFLENNFYSSKTQDWFPLIQFNYNATGDFSIETPPTATSTNRKMSLAYSGITFKGCSLNSWAMGIKWISDAGDLLIKNGVYGTSAGAMTYMYWGTEYNATANAMRYYQAASGLVTSCVNGFRIVQDGYGAFFRNYGSNLYILTTGKKTDGSEWTATYNSLRPLTINLATGLVTIGNGLTVTGTLTGTLTGNSSTATALETARSINGVSFDGSADITVPRSSIHVHTANGSNGSTGWVKICDIKITGTYANHPLFFRVAQRGKPQFILTLLFENKNSTDIGITSFRTESVSKVDFGGTATIVKASDNVTWGLYIQKTEAYDHIYVLDFSKANGDEGNKYTVTWTNVLSASKPTGGVDAQNKLSALKEETMLVTKGSTDYYGMMTPGEATNQWIRTTSMGLIPSEAGAAGSGHCKLGTATWYFSEAYIDTVYGTITNADNCNTTVTDPSTNTSYGIVFTIHPDTSEYNGMKKTNDFRLKHFRGAANTEGMTELVLGNSTAKNAADNSSGEISLYNENGKFTTFKPGTNSTGNLIIRLPDTAGTMTDIIYKTAKTASAVSNAGWTNNTTDDNIIPTMSFISYWNGRYNSSSSHLQYCDRGRFGTIVTKATGDYLAITGGTLTGSLTVNGLVPTTLASDADVNTVADGFWMSGTDGAAQSISNSPSTYGWAGLSTTLYSSGSDVRKTQIAWDRKGNMYIRGVPSTDGVFSSWKSVSLSGHTHSYLPLSGGTLTGDVTGTKFIGALTGNASTATKLATARTINGISFDGSANVVLPLRHCYHYDNSSDATTVSWHKVASTEITEVTIDRNIVFYVLAGYGTDRSGGILEAHIRSGSTAGSYNKADIKWLCKNNDGDMAAANFVLLYKADTTNKKLTAEIWCKITTRYHSLVFYVLAMSDRLGSSNATNAWTLNSTSDGASAYTSGMTAITSSLSLSTIPNTISRTLYDTDGSAWANTIGIGFAGNPITTSEFSAFACYTTKATVQGSPTYHIKDMNLATTKELLGIESDILFSGGTTSSTANIGYSVTDYQRLKIYATVNSMEVVVEIPALVGITRTIHAATPSPASQTNNIFYGVCWTLADKTVSCAGGKTSTLTSSASLSSSGVATVIKKIIGYKY